jgi:hypothetical protein
MTARMRAEARLLYFLASAVVLGTAAGLLLLVHPKVAAPIEVALVVLAWAASVLILGARTGTLALLVAACMISRYTYPLGPVDVRSEQVAAILGVGVLGYLIFERKVSIGVLKPNLSEWLLGAWFAVGLVASVTAAPETLVSLKGVALLVVASLGLLVPRRLLDREQATGQMDVIVKVLLLALALEGTYGAAAWLAHALGSTVSISANPVTGHLGAYGTLWEPNVFGSFCGAGAIAWAWLGPKYFRHSWLGMTACLAGTFASYTRAAWGAVVLVLLVSVAFGRLRERSHLRQVVIAVAAALVFTLLAFGAERIGDYYVPVVNEQGQTLQPKRGFFAVLLNEIDVLGRTDQLKIGGSEIKRHLLLGNGTASFGQYHLNRGQPQHIANLELTALYDTGIVGLLLLLAFGARVAYVAWRWRRDDCVAGLGMAALVIAITNVATETTELMITWLLVGLVLMAIDRAAWADPGGGPHQSADGLARKGAIKPGSARKAPGNARSRAPS